MFTRIVVPLDGSDLAAAALPTAEEIARLTGVPIHLVRVLDTSSFARLAGYPAYGTFVGVSALRESLRNEEAVAAAHLRAVKQELEERDLTVTVALEQGTPAEEIVWATRPGDLVVMSTHGRGGLGRWFLGSVAEEVVRHATVPIMLVRTTAHEPQERKPIVPAAAMLSS
jgi:nucleotide-binding universal stress UspA family protein